MKAASSIHHQGWLVIIFQRERNGAVLRVHAESGKSAAYIGTAPAPLKRRWWRSKTTIGVILLGVMAVVAVGVMIYSSSRINKAVIIDSVAVLPLVANSTDQNTQFLSDGITDSLIDGLSQIPNLKVMSRSSVFHYRGVSRQNVVHRQNE